MFLVLCIKIEDLVMFTQEHVSWSERTLRCQRLDLTDESASKTDIILIEYSDRGLLVVCGHCVSN